MAGIALSANAQNIYTYAGIGMASGYTGDGGNAVLAQIAGARGIAVSPAGDVFFSDVRNNAIRKVNAAGIITTIAGNGTAGYTGDGGAATAALINNPTGLRVDRYGNIFFSDSRNNVIRKITTSGIITTVAGNSTAAYTGDGGPATTASLNRPGGLDIDTAGILYIADTRNNVIRSVNTSGVITTIAGTGAVGYSGDGGPATAALFSTPTDVAALANGTLYVADARNNAIRTISTAGTINAFAGNGTAGYAGDGGLATAARINNPVAVTADAAGNVFIADLNNLVRVVNIHDTISTIAGNSIAGFSGDGGPALSARLNGPQGTAEDASGNIYISDNGNVAIRRVGAPVKSITITTSHHDTVCAGGTIHFTATAYADAYPNYQWRVNGAVVGSDSVSFTSSTLTRGNRVVCFLMDSAGTTRIAVSGTIFVDSAAFAGYILGPNTICTGSTTVLRDSASSAGGGGAAPGVWSTADATVATVSNGTPPGRVTGVSLGTDIIYYIVTNICGADTASYNITVVPNYMGTITGPARVCALDTAVFADTATGGTWRSRPGFIGAIDPATGVFVANAAPGIAYISYGVPGCTAIDSIIIDSLPVVPAIAGPTTVNTAFIITLTDALAGGTWSSNAPAIASVNATTGAVYGVTVGTATITYTVTSAFGCSGFNTYDITVVDASGIANVGNNAAISIYPNPINEATTINWTGLATGSAAVTITDVTGRVVLNTPLQLNAPNGNLKLNLPSLKPGVYVLQLTANNSKYYTKIVVE